VSVRVSDPNLLEGTRLGYFDVLIANKQETVNNIWTVNIDESAIEQWGQWPFDRRIYSQIIQDLYQRGAGLVIFNVLMSEEDRQGGDQQLSSVIGELPVILPNVPAASTKNQPKNPGAAILNSEYVDQILSYPGIIANIETLENSAAGVGIVGTLPEIDGVTRRMPLIVSVDGVLYPSLSLETLRVAAGDPSFQIRLNPYGVDALRIPKFGIISTDTLGRIWIDWSQQSNTVSVTRLPDNFDGAIVIVGTTAAGISNPVATAIGSVWPHQVQATVIGTLFNEVNIKRPDWTDGAELLSMLLIGILLLFLTRWVYVGLASVVLSVMSVVAVSYYGFNHYLYLIDITAPVIMIVLVSLHAYGIKFVSEFLQKQAIKRQFEGYASPTVVRLLQENPEIIKQGIKREVSICFSDLRGFTPLGESFGDNVAGLTRIMNEYMDAITQPVLDNNGMIIKYIGDASMHIHNAPVEDSDHARTAVRTGLQMLQAVERFNQEVIIPEGRPPVGMGAGINTGLGYIGEMGSTRRHSYDVLGDAVSTTARIESKCKEYGCLLLVGENTVRQCGDDFLFLKIDDLAVKGKTVGVGIYTVLSTIGDASMRQVKAQRVHDEMHQLYRSQDFDGAIELCQQLKTEFDGKMLDYYTMWMERCLFLREQKLPDKWNGVWIATSK
jgi:adenylate cyclase